VNLKIQQLDVIIETKTKIIMFLWNLKFLCNSWLSRKQFMMLL
jgi:hypothetical protein